MAENENTGGQTPYLGRHFAGPWCTVKAGSFGSLALYAREGNIILYSTDRALLDPAHIDRKLPRLLI